MTDRNSPEEVEKRRTQTDPLVMYLVVRESLGMSIGKTAAQCAHASQMLTLKYFELKDTQVYGVENVLPHRAKLDLFQEWINASFRKVVLRADDKEWEKLKLAFPDATVVVDAGLTEIAAGSETVIGLWPMLRSEAQKTMVKKLQVLK